MFSFCLSHKPEFDFDFEIEYQNDDISKLKTTACSNEERNYDFFKTLKISFQIMHENINLETDFLYINECCSEINVSQLKNENILKINIVGKSNIRSNFFGMSSVSFKKIAINEE